MKAIKISLLIIAIGAIAYFVVKSLGNIPPEKEIDLPKNQFTMRIESEIDSLRRFPESRFCSDYYHEVNYRINDYYKKDRFGVTSSENEQWNDNLTKDLYSAYVDKFIQQAFYVFKGSQWEIEKLNFIRKESQSLRKSPFLEKGSPMDKKFAEIQAIFNKYDEINSFISKCNGFSFSSYNLSDNYPISDVHNYTSQSKAYLSDNLDNIYVNNCSRLKASLQEIPQSLFDAHIRYLDKKIEQWSNMYPDFSSQKDYSQNLYSIIEKQINLDLNNSIYNVSNFDREQKRLLSKWSADNVKAYKYDYSAKR